jgi:hypothetical protein
VYKLRLVVVAGIVGNKSCNTSKLDASADGTASVSPIPSSSFNGSVETDTGAGRLWGDDSERSITAVPTLPTPETLASVDVNWFTALENESTATMSLESACDSKGKRHNNPQKPEQISAGLSQQPGTSVISGAEQDARMIAMISGNTCSSLFKTPSQSAWVSGHGLETTPWSWVSLTQSE